MTPPDNYGAQPPAEKPLTPADKEKWNKFIGFVEANGMKNNPILDQRNKGIGMALLQKFNLANPKDALPTDVVPKVQQALQDYRTNLIGQWKAGKVQADGVKTEDDLMPGLSAVDGWPGTKTLSHRFPIAKTDTKDYGTDVTSYDKDRGLTGAK